MRSGGVDESRRNTHKTRKQRRVDDKPNKEAPATAGACEKKLTNRHRLETPTCLRPSRPRPSSLANGRGSTTLLPPPAKELARIRTTKCSRPSSLCRGPGPSKSLLSALLMLRKKRIRPIHEKRQYFYSRKRKIPNSHSKL